MDSFADRATAHGRLPATLTALLVAIAAALTATVSAARADNAATVTASSSQAYTVPAGTSYLHVVAFGARGGNSWANPQLIAGGRGGAASGTLRVTPGQTLQIHIGSAGGDGSISGFPGGGANCGGNAASGAGAGGGASDVRTANSSVTSSALVVAGGGGGGGADGYGWSSDMREVWHPPGGTGGDADQSGAEGGYANNATGGAKGGSAGSPAGNSQGGTGSGAAATGGSGTPGCGGNGSNGNNSGPGGTNFPQAGGGGGGGGYYGGGGGGAGCGIGTCGTAAGGGGGGSNFVVANAINKSTAVNTGGSAPLVKVTPVTPITIAIGPPSISGGQRVATVTATVQDFAGSPATADIVDFTSSSSSQTFSDYQNHGDGTYTMKITSPSTGPSATVAVKSLGLSGAAGEPIQASMNYPPPSTTGVFCGSAQVGTAATCTVTVSGGGARPTGTVQFTTESSGGLSPLSCTLASSGDNQCQIAYTPAAVESGIHRIPATYNGDLNYGGSIGTASVVVTKGTPSTAVDCAPASSAVGVGVTCTASVTGIDGAAMPSGTVTFDTTSGGGEADGSFTPATCTLTGFGITVQCSVTYKPRQVRSGTHTISAAYSGDANWAVSSNTTTVSATQGSTQTAISCAPSTAAVGVTTTCTATVSGGGVSPTGPVLFTSNSQGRFTSAGSPPNTCTLAPSGAGQSSCAITYLPTERNSGTHAMTATYTGDSSYFGSSKSAAITVPKGPAETSVACAPSSAAVGTSATCTATVHGAGVDPGGSVSFATGVAGTFGSGGSCALTTTASGPGAGERQCTVTYSPSVVGPGSHTITATYGGDANYDSDPGTTTIAVTKGSSSVDVACAPTSTGVGATTTCTATVAGPGARPGGTVSFSSDSAGDLGPSGECTLPASGDNKCSVSYEAQQVDSGIHTITAAYGGDANHNESSDSTTQTVTLGDSSVAVVCDPGSAKVGAAVDCTATVSGGGARPAGTVTFSSDSAGDLGSSGKCTLPGTGDNKCNVSYAASQVALGTHTITATYGGDANHLTSDGTTGVTVSKADSATALDCRPAARSHGNEFVCEATVSGAGARPAGHVGFTSDSAGSFGSSGTCSLPTAGDDKCSVTYTPSSVDSGTHTITAGYGGDANHKDSSGDDGVTVSKRTSATALACAPAAASIGNAVSCTATVADSDTGTKGRPSGTVQFSSDGSGALGSSGACALPASGATACSITYTPSAVGSGAHKLSAAYSGDAGTAASSGGATVAVNKRATATSVSCAPAPVQVGTATTCTATVADDDSGTKHRPGGTVTFSSDGTGELGSGGSCALPADAEAGCSVSYTPATGGSGTHTIGATYSGDDSHATSSASAAVTATLPPPVTPPAPALVRAAVSHLRIALSNRGLALVGVRCSGPKAGVCAGTVSLQSTSYGSRVEASSDRTARAMRFTIASGKTRTLEVEVPKASKQTLKRHRRAVAMAIIRLTQPDGSTSVVRRAVTLVPAR